MCIDKYVHVHEIPFSTTFLQWQINIFRIMLMLNSALYYLLCMYVIYIYLYLQKNTNSSPSLWQYIFLSAINVLPILQQIDAVDIAFGQQTFKNQFSSLKSLLGQRQGCDTGPSQGIQVQDFVRMYKFSSALIVFLCPLWSCLSIRFLF